MRKGGWGTEEQGGGNVGRVRPGGEVRAVLFLVAIFVKFKLTLRPVGCSENLQKILGGQPKTREIYGMFWQPHNN